MVNLYKTCDIGIDLKYKITAITETASWISFHRSKPMHPQMSGNLY